MPYALMLLLVAGPPLGSSDAPVVEQPQPLSPRIIRHPPAGVVAPGYSARWLPNVPLVAAGAGVLVVSWGLTVLLSALKRAGLFLVCGNQVQDCGVDPNRQPLDYVPLVGPLLAAPPNAFNVTSTVLQWGGVAMAIVGVSVAAETIWVRDSPVRLTANGLSLAF